MIAGGSRTVDEVRRLAALDRLDIVHTAPEVALDAAVRTVRELVDAHGAALTLVGAERAWSKASTFGQMEVERDRSLADLVVVGDEDAVELTVRPGHPLAEHPGLAGLDLPVTCAAIRVCAPGGEAVGAIEVVFGDPRVLDAELLARLRRSAAHVAYLLELRAQAREYDRFIDLSPDPVAVLDSDGRIVLANAALATLLGVGHQRVLVGETFLELVDRPDRMRATAALARVVFGRARTTQLDLRLVRPDGVVVPCSISAGHLRGARRHLQLVVHDLSDRIRGEEQRSHLSEQLARAQRLDAVGQVAGGLAHDLNNLLMVMLSNLSFARESLEDAEAAVGPDAVADVRRDLGELQVAVERAGRLTNQLLEFARRHDGDEELADVVEVIHTVTGLISRSLGEDVVLETEVDPGLPLVAADPVKLERALVNLVINARDALDGRGSIRIVASASDPDPEDRRDVAAPWVPTVVVEVADDGRGMDASVRARAFEPLYTTKGEAGSGLGLATVAAFADEVDGSVRLESTPGLGTRVTLSLPVADQPIGTLPVGLDVPVGGARVVLVDPGERTRRVIAQMLQGAGYRVRAVGTAEDALPLVADAELLITELALPAMSGVRLIEAATQRNLVLRAIALATVEAPRTLDATPVLVKPFSHTRLLRTVERVLRDR